MCLGAPLFIQHADVNSSTSTAHQLKASDGLFALVLPPSSNIKDLNFFITVYRFIKKIELLFNYYLFYYLKYFKHFCIFICMNFLNKVSD